MSGAHIHYIDVANWFMGKVPVSAMGMGARVIPGYGNGYDMMSMDYVFDNEVHMNSYTRRILGCSGRWDAIIMGEESAYSGTGQGRILRTTVIMKQKCK